MATVRYLVDDVDAALAFYATLGFALTERWGPPFAIVARAGAHFRCEPVAGPGGRQVLVDDPPGNPVELFEARA